MIEMEKPKIMQAEASEDGKYGKIVVEPLERGYGITLGNSLRRILLSSLPGVAATSIKFDKEAAVLHEFSTITGVKEDVTEIILNIKNLIAKLHCDGPKEIVLNAEGAGEITAADFEADADVEILNPELHIATLDEDAKFTMTVVIDKGIGYDSADKNKASNAIVFSHHNRKQFVQAVFSAQQIQCAKEGLQTRGHGVLLGGYRLGCGMRMAVLTTAVIIGLLLREVRQQFFCKSRLGRRIHQFHCVFMKPFHGFITPAAQVAAHQ